MHMVNWDTVTLPTDHGGLGIQLFTKGSRQPPFPAIIKDCIAKAAEFFFLTQGANPSFHKRSLPFSWVKPNPGWHKLNMDAFVLSSSNYASGRGLLRDSNGSWVKGFSRKIGTSSCLLAKLWALRDGLIMARNNHVEKLIINVDALEVINLLSNTKATNQLTQPIMDDCKNILQAFQEVHLQHCYRETNKVADFLAKLGHRQSDPFVYYVTPPFGIMEALSDDASNAVCILKPLGL
ncbi:hypothetical protein SO802_021053 [Lithocarpus litseifolius]|uniref:RNase H type-1 domain-containing protein n=1 Tax=Lithocarpus litseifolius TaxID=425828 RepID=A0AAW2CFP8_9ROSI